MERKVLKYGSHKNRNKRGTLTEEIRRSLDEIYKFKTFWHSQKFISITKA